MGSDYLNPALQTAKRNELFALIKKVGLHYGEDIDFLRQYAREVVLNNNIDQALNCFKDLVEQFKHEPIRKNESA